MALESFSALPTSAAVPTSMSIFTTTRPRLAKIYAREGVQRYFSEASVKWSSELAWMCHREACSAGLLGRHSLDQSIPSKLFSPGSGELNHEKFGAGRWQPGSQHITSLELGLGQPRRKAVGVFLPVREQSISALNTPQHQFPNDSGMTQRHGP